MSLFGAAGKWTRCRGLVWKVGIGFLMEARTIVRRCCRFSARRLTALSIPGSSDSVQRLGAVSVSALRDCLVGGVELRGIPGWQANPWHLRKTIFVGVNHQFEPATDFKFVEDGGQVMPNGSFRNEQTLRYLFVPSPFAKQSDDFQFALCQACDLS